MTPTSTRETLVSALVADQYSFITHGARPPAGLNDELCKLLAGGFKGYGNFTDDELLAALADARTHTTKTQTIYELEASLQKAFDKSQDAIARDLDCADFDNWLVDIADELGSIEEFDAYELLRLRGEEQSTPT
jgi:hypothetical protein